MIKSNIKSETSIFAVLLYYNSRLFARSFCIFYKEIIEFNKNREKTEAKEIFSASCKAVISKLFTALPSRLYVTVPSFCPLTTGASMLSGKSIFETIFELLFLSSTMLAFTSQPIPIFPCIPFSTLIVFGKSSGAFNCVTEKFAKTVIEQSRCVRKTLFTRVTAENYRNKAHISPFCRRRHTTAGIICSACFSVPLFRYKFFRSLFVFTICVFFRHEDYQAILKCNQKNHFVLHKFSRHYRNIIS